MASYKEQGIRNDVLQAYKNNERPISKWTKAKIMCYIREMLQNGELSLKCSIDDLDRFPIDVLRKCCLYRTSGHHVGKYRVWTDFYSIDAPAVSELTNGKLNEALSAYTAEKGKEKVKEKKKVAEGTWKCSYLEWTDFKKNRKPKAVKAVGEIRGNWFFLPDGKKKSIKAKGFRFIKKIR